MTTTWKPTRPTPRPATRTSLPPRAYAMVASAGVYRRQKYERAAARLRERYERGLTIPTIR